ncbi:MAG: response regulator [bacterium]
MENPEQDPASPASPPAALRRIEELEQQLRATDAERRKTRDQVEQLFRVSAAILVTSELEEQLRLVAGGIVAACNYRRCMITLFDDEWRVRMRAHAGLTSEEARSLEEAPALSPETRRRILDERYRIGNSYFVPHESKLGEQLSGVGVRTSRREEDFVDWHPEDYLFVPLRGQEEKVLGTISVDDPDDGRRPTPQSLRVLELFAREAAFAIEQNQLMRELRTAEGYLENVVKNSRDAIITTDTEGRIVVWNAGATRMLGWTAEEMIGQSVLKGYASEREAHEIMRAIMSGEHDEPGHLENRATVLLSREGEHIPVSLTATALYDEAGAFLGTAGISRDLRPWKRLEREIAAAQKAQTLGEVAATLCHEINNFLEEILSAGHVALLTLDRGDVREMYEQAGKGKMLQKEMERLAVISKEALKIAALTNQLQTIARGGVYKTTEYVGEIQMMAIPEKTGKTSGRILVADDREHIREFLRDFLVLQGFEVDVAEDGQQAVDMARASHYDLVLSDIKMPGKNGYEVFQGVRDSDPSTQVILMTAYGYDPSHSIVKASERGLTDVLYKPFQMGKVRDAIVRALAERKTNGKGPAAPPSGPC